MRKTKPVRVWIGFVDGRPWVEETADNYDPPGRRIEAFTTRAAARKRFQDVRRMVLVPEEPRP